MLREKSVVRRRRYSELTRCAMRDAIRCPDLAAVARNPVIKAINARTAERR